MSVSPARRRFRRVIATAALAAAATQGIASSAHAAISIDRRTLVPRVSIPSNLNLNLNQPAPVPTKKALLVLLENGGYSFGMPAEATVEVPTCSTFQMPAGTDLVSFIASLGNSIFSAPSCLNPANWTTEEVNVAQWVTGASDAVIEGATAASVTAAAAPKYDKVVVLQNGDFGPARVRQELTNLAPQYLIDVHVLSHGDQGAISGGGGVLSASDVSNFSTIPNLHLRSVYQQNCFGSSMNAAWVAAGAKAVNGSTLINSMPLSYGSFLNRWLSGQSFQQAVNGSYNDWKPFFENLYHFVDLYTPSQAPRDPAAINLLGGLSAADELAESTMILAGPNTGVTL